MNTGTRALIVTQAAASWSPPALSPAVVFAVALLSYSGQRSCGAAPRLAGVQCRRAQYDTGCKRCPGHVAQLGSRGCAAICSGLLHATRLCYERNVVRNTLADTPSGYIQDPRAHPATMPRYEGLSRIGAATLEAIESERELLEREELAYTGYTTLRIQELKHTVMRKTSTTAELELAADALREELAALCPLIGQEVEKPLSKERLLLLKWQQRQQRLQDRESAFQVNSPSTPAFRVVPQVDGTEVIERPGRDTPLEFVHETDDAYLSQAVEAEELLPEGIIREKTLITAADVNHVRYLLGLTYRRLKRCDEAEKIFYEILADDITNVDAVESLLELDTGMEGWVPRIRLLLNYLDEEFTKAVAEGRLQSASVSNRVPVIGSYHTEEPRAAPGRDAVDTSRSRSQKRSSSQSSLVSPTDAVVAEVGTDVACTPTPEYKALPTLAPVEVALSLLSDLIVEAAAQKISTDGEGAASRFFIEALGPIVSAIGRDYACALLEALFRAIDEQHFFTRFDSVDMSPAARSFALSLVIAFLKALMARRIHEMLPEPTRFHFFTLVKLHTALRSAGRVHESYRICEQMMQLYRANSLVHRARMNTAPSATLGSSPLPAISLLQSSPYGGCSSALAASEAKDIATAPTEVEAQKATDEGCSSPVQAANTNHEPTPAPEGLPKEALSTKSRQPGGPTGILDDQDSNYREAFFQYVSDRARDSPALGRRLCMEAMAEFPQCAAPWETLALIMHKEDPKRNLGDAIIAARRAMELEPFNVKVIVTLASFYKASHRYELYDRMMDRYRLMLYMIEEGASEADMVATAAEIAALDEQTPGAQDLVEETGRTMKEFLERMEQALTYSMPIDKEPRPFRNGPIRFIAQQPDMRPPEVEPHDKELLRQLQIVESRQQRQGEAAVDEDSKVFCPFPTPQHPRGR